MGAAHRDRAVTLARAAGGAARGDGAVIGAPQRDSLDRGLGGEIGDNRRGVDRMPGDELVSAPDIIGARRAAEGRSHRDDLGHRLRIALGEFPREQPAKAPAEQHHRAPVARMEISQPCFERFEALLVRPPVETQPPALGGMPRRLQRLRQIAHPHRMGGETGQDHHHLRIGGGGNGELAAAATHRFEQHLRLAQHPRQLGLAGLMLDRDDLAGQRDAARQLALFKGGPRPGSRSDELPGKTRKFGDDAERAHASLKRLCS